MIDKLLYKYYYISEGILDPIPRMITCFESCIYFTLKLSLPHHDGFCDLFLRDINVVLLQNESDKKFNSVITYPLQVNNNMVSLNRFTGNGKKALLDIYKILDSGKYVIAQTYYKRLSYHKDFISIDEPIESVDFSTYHSFLIIGYENGDIFYVDAPYNINNKFYLPYSNNNSIGVIKENDFLYAADAFLNYWTIEIIDDYKFNSKNVKSILDSIITNYYKDSSEFKGFFVSFGKKAVDNLINIIYDDNKQKNQNPYLSNKFKEWDFKSGISQIHKTRLLLNAVLLRYLDSNFCFNMEDIFKYMNLSISSWQLIRNITEKWIISGNNPLYKLKLCEYLKEANLNDEALIKELSKFHNVRDFKTYN